ncbi:MAG: hypothetical protein ACREKE_09330, partial [bacterium]
MRYHLGGYVLVFYLSVLCIGIIGAILLAALLLGVLPKHPHLTSRRLLLLVACVGVVLASAFAWAYAT